ncbi:histone acetyltransferases subunit 3-domain-containing protein [Collybia nuda]|uniref:Histone acetyltransferases subunit 3-domain-containing protein n=1 Tax=Collybia nuda TaxID=64659 RepID=A0A9P5Y9X5_9AGAR|nr:histone acetyltransferases subunit 3-domain-containing protein [Collybia nuda]
MSAKLSAYSVSPNVQSTLLLKTPDSIPPTNELEILYNELNELKKLTLARAKKASEDLRTIEESMRRMSEKEKGKAKAIDKVKRERDFTPLLDAEETKSVKSLHSHLVKSRLPSHPATSLPPSARSSLDPRRSAADDLKKKKKKRKREPGDSDGEHDIQRPRKSTPPVNHVHSHSQPPKAQKSIVSSSPHNKPPIGPDFSVPVSAPLLPPRPPIPPPPIPGPSKPTEVMEDFSKSKQPAQILVTSFYSSIEPWLRNIREEDVGFLEYTGDEVEPYIMPKLGRHYTEIWEDQDAGLLPPTVLGDTEAPSSNFAAPVPKWDPSTLMEPDLVTEERGHGPLTERVISALLPIPDITVWKGVKAAEDAMEGRPGGSGAAAARREKMNVSDLETRIRDTMRYHGLLDGMPDYTEKVDDPIATALRHAQRELRTVVATNKARKERLVAIARDRLGYQEYLDLRESIDKNITNTFGKLQKKDGPKIGKKKKKITDTNGDGNGSTTGPVPCPAALGMTPDEENKLHVNDQLQHLVEVRRDWVREVGSEFEAIQEMYPGRLWGFPLESVYQGIDEEVQAMLLSSTPDPARQVVKGKATDRGDEMDIG